jgi:hypothetical protein
MPPFLHRRLSDLEGLLRSSADALQASVDGAPSLVGTVLAHLEGAAAVYEHLGIPDAQNQMVALTAQLAQARGGINPLTLERVTTYRRALQRTVALHVLQAGSERLRADYADVRAALAALRERLTPLALYAVEKGLTPPDPGRRLTQAELEAVWHALGEDPTSRPATREVAAGAATADILLALGDLLESVAGAARDGTLVPPGQNGNGSAPVPGQDGRRTPP